jgi:hypothetical protein
MSKVNNNVLLCVANTEEVVIVGGEKKGMILYVRTKSGGNIA